MGQHVGSSYYFRVVYAMGLGLDIDKIKRRTAEFLNLGTTDILGQVTLSLSLF